MKDKILNTLSMAIIIFTIGTLLLGIFWMFEDNPPVSYPNQPSKAIVKGSNVYMTLEYCRYSDKPFTSYATFVDGILFHLQPEKISGTGVGCGNLTRAYPIPETLPNGKYKMVFRNEFEINPISTISVSQETEYFIINRTGE